jgi:plasmid stabilization system protein ParE
MCYSAQIQADYRRYVKMFGAQMDIREFARLFWERADGSKSKIPKAVEDAFASPQNDDERQIKEFIDRFNVEQANKLEQELFKQRTRLADAERTLQSKATKAAAESKRISTDKIEAALRRLEDLKRTLKTVSMWSSPCVTNVASLGSPRITTRGFQALTTRVPTASVATGARCLGTRTVSSSSAVSTKT